MRVRPISANAFQLTRFGVVNCYLVREYGEPDTFTLIDTGVKGSEDQILKAAEKAGAAIRRILLTHAHVDHVGSVDALVAKLGRIELAASPRSLPLLRRPPNKSLEPGETGGEIKGGLPGIAAKPTHLIEEGELYGSLRVIHTPGHIPGHLSFLDERDGTLFAGDALVAVGRLAVTGFAPWYFPLPNSATQSKATALVSAGRLLDYPIQRFACGHGKVREGGVDLLREVIVKAPK